MNTLRTFALFGIGFILTGCGDKPAPTNTAPGASGGTSAPAVSESRKPPTDSAVKPASGTAATPPAKSEIEKTGLFLPDGVEETPTEGPKLKKPGSN
jgi:hypothetical protein